MPIYKRIDAFAAAREVSARYVANDGPYLSLSGLGLLALILTVAAVQTIGATIMAGCFGNHGLSCRDTKSSNPSPSSGESDERPTRPLQSMIALMSVDDHPGFGRKTHAHMPEGLRTAGRAHGSIRIQEGQPTALIEQALDPEAGAIFGLDEHQRDAPRPLGWIGLANDDYQPGEKAVRDKGLGAIDCVLVAAPLGARADALQI
jgi:hypothetical protein